VPLIIRLTTGDLDRLSLCELGRTDRECPELYRSDGNRCRYRSADERAGYIRPLNLIRQYQVLCLVHDFGSSRDLQLVGALAEEVRRGPTSEIRNWKIYFIAIPCGRGPDLAKRLY